MGNQGSAAHKGLLQSPLYAEYQKERKAFKGETDFSPEEVCWLMYHFISTTQKLGEEPVEVDSFAKKKLLKQQPIYSKFYFLAELTVTQDDASNIVVYGKKLQLYPLIARRIWSVLDPNHTKMSSFLTWIDALRVIAFGSFSQKMKMAFRLFNKATIDRQDVNNLFSEIGEFLSEIGLGITDAIEFLIIKSFAWDEIFANTPYLDEKSWISNAEAYAALVAPFDVLNVVLGQDIRRMDEDLKTPRVFGQSLNKLAFGYSSDFTGTRVLVPEILLTACRFFESATLHDLPNLFDTKVALTMASEMRKQLDEGVPLKRILLNCHKDINRLHYYAVGTLLRDFCDQLPRPIFGFQACGRLTETNKKRVSPQEKLEIFVAIFTEMETVYTLLISFFQRLPISERPGICKLFSRSRIFRYSDGTNSKSKQNREELEEILDFMISNSEYFIAVTVSEKVNPWERIMNLENQIANLQQQIEELRRGNIAAQHAAPPTYLGASRGAPPQACWSSNSSPSVITQNQEHNFQMAKPFKLTTTESRSSKRPSASSIFSYSQ